jgi:GH43 family beta-xylosidase
MNRDLIRQHLTSRACAIIRTSDGRQYAVAHAEFVLIGRHNVVVEHPNGYLEIIDPLHIVSIRHTPRRKTRKTAR